MVVIELVNNVIDYGVLQLNLLLKKDLNVFEIYYVECSVRIEVLEQGEVFVLMYCDFDLCLLIIKVLDFGVGYDVL